MIGSGILSLVACVLLGWFGHIWYSYAHPPHYTILPDNQDKISLIHLDPPAGNTLTGFYEGIAPRFLFGTEVISADADGHFTIPLQTSSTTSKHTKKKKAK